MARVSGKNKNALTYEQTRIRDAFMNDILPRVCGYLKLRVQRAKKTGEEIDNQVLCNVAYSAITKALPDLTLGLTIKNVQCIYYNRETALLDHIDLVTTHGASNKIIQKIFHVYVYHCDSFDYEKYTIKPSKIGENISNIQISYG